MPYLALLSIFALLVGVEGAVVLVCALVPSLRSALPYGWRMLVGSSVGFVVGYLASMLLGGVAVVCAAALDIDRDHPAAQIVVAVVLIGFVIGPLVASPLGFLGGAWFGLQSARRSTAPARAQAPVASAVRADERARAA